MALVYAPSNMLKKYMVAFSDLFRNIAILSRDGGKYILPIRMGLREKLFSLSQVMDETRNKFRYSLPLLGFALNSMSLDTNRALTMANTMSSSDQMQKIRNPVPYDFSIELFLLCNRASELYEVLEAILPMYQQSRMFPLIEYKFLDGSELKRSVPIILESNSIEIKGDLTAEEEQVFSANLTFKVQGYLHNSYITVSPALAQQYYGSTGTSIGYIINPDGGTGVIQQIDITFEEYIADTYERLMGTITLTESTGGTVIETKTGDL